MIANRNGDLFSNSGGSSVKKMGDMTMFNVNPIGVVILIGFVLALVLAFKRIKSK